MIDADRLLSDLTSGLQRSDKERSNVLASNRLEDVV